MSVVWVVVWVTVAVVGYLAGAAITAVVWEGVNADEDPTLLAFVAGLWPFMAVCGIFWVVAVAAQRVAGRVFGRC